MNRKPFIMLDTLIQALREKLNVSDLNHDKPSGLCFTFSSSMINWWRKYHLLIHLSDNVIILIITFFCVSGHDKRNKSLKGKVLFNLRLFMCE